MLHFTRVWACAELTAPSTARATTTLNRRGLGAMMQVVALGGALLLGADSEIKKTVERVSILRRSQTHEVSRG
jgi:hypothetical protein